MATYYEKLQDPRWQKKRLEIFERDQFTCQECWTADRTLAVHHHYYERGLEPWDYPSEALLTVCKSCHDVLGNAQLALQKETARLSRYGSGFIKDLADSIGAMPHFQSFSAIGALYEFFENSKFQTLITMIHNAADTDPEIINKLTLAFKK